MGAKVSVRIQKSKFNLFSVDLYENVGGISLQERPILISFSALAVVSALLIIREV